MFKLPTADDVFTIKWNYIQYDYNNEINNIKKTPEMCYHAMKLPHVEINEGRRCTYCTM